MIDPRDQHPDRHEPDNPGRDPNSDIFASDSHQPSHPAPNAPDPYDILQPASSYHAEAPSPIDPAMMAPPDSPPGLAPPELAPPTIPGPLHGTPNGMPIRAHNAGAILTLGISSLVVAVLSVPCCGLFPVAMAAAGLGIASFLWGTRELRAMDQGLIDPSGRSAASVGRICGAIGAIIGSLIFALFVCFMVFGRSSVSTLPTPPPPPLPAPSGNSTP